MKRREGRKNQINESCGLLVVVSVSYGVGPPRNGLPPLVGGTSPSAGAAAAAALSRDQRGLHLPLLPLSHQQYHSKRRSVGTEFEKTAPSEKMNRYRNCTLPTSNEIPKKPIGNPISDSLSLSRFTPLRRSSRSISAGPTISCHVRWRSESGRRGDPNVVT